MSVPRIRENRRFEKTGPVCKVAKNRNWHSCKDYKPISDNNICCISSGCMNVCAKNAIIRAGD